MTEEHDLGGQTRHEGDQVLMLYEWADRDETDVDEFRTVGHLIVSRLVEVLVTPGPAAASDDDRAREGAPILLGR